MHDSMSMMQAPDSWDVLHSASSDDLFWTTTNVGEAAPGVQTPLSLSTWRRAVGAGVAASGRAIGVFTESDGYDGEVLVPFYGRACMSVNFLRLFGERMPGASAEEVVHGFIGHVPDGMTFAPTRRFYANVLRTYPGSFHRLPGQLVAFAAEQDRWWQGFIARVAEAAAEEAAARRLLDEALAQHYAATVLQCVSVFAAVQPVHDVLVRTVDSLGGDVSRLTAPVGGAETAVIGDLWRASRGLLNVEDVVARHGFHGPREGELESRVWREDDTPVRQLVEQYAAREENQSPARQEEATREARAAAEADLLAATPPYKRPGVRMLLKLGARRIGLRGVAKRSMLQGFDGVRTAARHLGNVLPLDAPDDAFYFTVDELTGSLPPGARELVALRRERRGEYARFDLPGDWAGVPEPVVHETEPVERATLVTGVGVSAGIVEGTARVVTDPAFADVEPDEILVAPTTDPSWASIMFISAGLVVNIGGALSHAAVVARELGLPCVVNTQTGTSAIRTGDRIRVDGDQGTVEILSPR